MVQPFESGSLLFHARDRCPGTGAKSEGHGTFSMGPEVIKGHSAQMRGILGG
jgi:hypothetical protein